MKLGWILFTACIALPGVAELYAALKLLPYIRKSSGLLPFIFCFSSGLFDMTFTIIMTAILVLDLPLILTVDLSNPVLLFIVIFIISTFLEWRISSALISLWFAGVLPMERIKPLFPVLNLKRRRDDT